MDIKQARKLAKMIKQLDIMLFGLKDGKTEKYMRESRKSMDYIASLWVES